MGIGVGNRGAKVWYNENQLFVASWLSNLSNANVINPGVIDARDIREVSAGDIKQAVQFHAFAGVGVWSYALRLAGWPDDAPVWTGSCPCQPFSGAGRKRGIDDERHLWPEWFRLIRECRPPIIFGEQVASPAGRAWFDVVSADLEGLGYAVGAADLCAAGVGAPHVRQRLFFVACYPSARWFGWGAGEASFQTEVAQEFGRYRNANELGTSSILGNTDGERSEWKSRIVFGAQTEDCCCGRSDRGLTHGPEFAGHTRGFWADAEWVWCRDGKYRPFEPGSFPLAHGAAGRMAVVRPGEQAETQARWYNRSGTLMGVGNSIVPQVAAAFVESAVQVILDAG